MSNRQREMVTSFQQNGFQVSYNREDNKVYVYASKTNKTNLLLFIIGGNNND